MRVEALIVLAFIVVGAYRLYAVRRNRTEFVMWLLLIAGSIAIPLSKLIPGGRIPLLVLAPVLIVAGIVMYTRIPEPKSDDTLGRPPG